MTKNLLPIEVIKAALLSTLATEDTLILSAPPGAGKSTCLPLWLLALPEFSAKKIYLLQPRRIAVKNIALYLAKQLGEQVGQRVGYRLRDESKTSDNTQLEVITEGILTQIIQNDAELAGCGLVIFDEFHERSLQGDLAFALARDIQQGLRDDLKILLMSATLNSENLRKQLPDAVSIQSEGRSYPVEITYQAPKNSQYWRDHLLSVLKLQLQHHQGSLLVFLPGVGDIRYVSARIIASLPATTDLHSLYGDLTLQAQQQVIAPTNAGRQKVVLSTNIAETSLTIEGINCVIDCGFEKRAIYDNASLTNKLVQQKISKASAIQRAGRAGRLMAGQCIRLYAKEDFDRRTEQGVSEIQQADLTPTLIEAARWGVTQLSDLPLLELPSAINEQRAWQTLNTLAIVNEQRQLTPHGKQVALLSCHPRFAQMILRAKSLDVIFPETRVKHTSYASLACIVAAMLEERDIFRGEVALINCDLRDRLRTLLSSPANYKTIVKQATRLAKQSHIVLIKQTNSLPVNDVGLLLALAYPERIAKARSNKVAEYLLVNGKGACINSQDSLINDEFIVVAHLMQNQHGELSSLNIRLAAPIDQTQIDTLCATKIVSTEKLFYSEKNNKIMARKQTRLDAIILSEKNITVEITTEKLSAMWCELVRVKGIKFLNSDFLAWQTNDITLKNRWRWLNNFVPNANLPVLTEQYLLEKLDCWLSPFVGNIRSKAQLNKLNLSSMLLTLLDHSQQKLLNQLAPEYYKGPTGRRCPIRYHSEQKSPKMSVIMQEIYGLLQSPMVGAMQNSQGIPLVLELLSPAKQPIQVTQNLAQFWQGSYKAVQKDMKSRYPKHYWPDDPANAKPTNKTKRFL